MKALSLWQPWATLVAIGAKTYETRHWAFEHRGPLAIHAARKWNPELRRMCQMEPFRSALLAAGYEPHRTDWGLPFGAIVATVNLTACLRITASGLRFDDGAMIPLPDEPERCFGDFTPGRFAYQLSDVARLSRPVPFRGMQGPFYVPTPMLAGGDR